VGVRGTKFMSSDVCPNCADKFHYFEKVKIDAESGKKNVNQCPLCKGYFEATYKNHTIWLILLVNLPLFVNIFIPKTYDEIKIWVLVTFFLFFLFPIVFFIDRKKKKAIKDKGHWVVVKPLIK